jgi:hypothetical protein
LRREPPACFPESPFHREWSFRQHLRDHHRRACDAFFTSQIPGRQESLTAYLWERLRDHLRDRLRIGPGTISASSARVHPRYSPSITATSPVLSAQHLLRVSRGSEPDVEDGRQDKEEPP